MAQAIPGPIFPLLISSISSWFEEPAEPAATNLLVDISTNKTSPAKTEEWCYRIRYRNASITEHSSNAYLDLTLPLGAKATSLPGVGGNVSKVTSSGDPSTGVYIRIDLKTSGASHLEAGSSGAFKVCAVWTCVPDTVVQSPSAGTAVNLVNPLKAYDDSGTYEASNPSAITVPAFKSCPAPKATSSEFSKVQGEGFVVANPGGSFEWRVYPKNPSTDQIEYVENIPDELSVYNFRTDRLNWAGWTVSCDCGNGFVPIYTATGVRGRHIETWINHQKSKETFPNLLGSDGTTDTGCDAIFDELRNVYNISGLKAIKWTTAAEGYTSGNNSNHIRIYSLIDENLPVGTVIQNCATATNLTTNESLGTSCEEITLVQEPLVTGFNNLKDKFGTDVVKNPSGYTKQLDDLVFEIGLTYENMNANGHTGFTLTDTLDKGLTYIEGGSFPNWYAVDIKNWYSKIPDVENPANQSGCSNPVFSKTIISDGRTVLKWEFPACYLPKGYVHNSSTRIRVYFSVRYDRTIVLPENNYRLRWGVDLGKNVWKRNKKGTLVRVVNGNRRIKLGDNSTFGGVGSVDSRKWGKGALDNDFSRFPSFGSTNLSGEGAYEIFVYNLSDEPIDRVDIVDVLPHLNDSSMLSNQARESKWSVELVSGIKIEHLDIPTNTYSNVPDEDLPFGILYGDSYDVCFLDETNSVRADMALANLPSNCSDLSDGLAAEGAKAFGFRWENTNTPLQFGQALKITLNVQQLSGELDATSGDVAWNSFAFTANQIYSGELLSSEPLKVGVQMINKSTTGSIKDYVWFDNNGNKIKDTSEPGVEGVTVSIFDSNGDTVRVAGFPYQVLTDSTGAFEFNGLAQNSSYKVVLDNPNDFSGAGQLKGYTLTTPGISSGNPELTIATPAAGASAPDLTGFGYVKPGSVGNLVWIDSDPNGIQDAGEPGFAGMKVVLCNEENTRLDSTTTDENGNYGFSELMPGNYYLIFSGLPTDTLFTVQDFGSDDGVDSDANASGKTAIFSLQMPNMDIANMDVGIRAKPASPAAISGTVWDELGSNNGVLDTGEPKIAGVKVQLLDDGQFLLAETQTDSVGAYSFEGLNASIDYYVQFLSPDPAINFTSTGSDMDADANGLTTQLSVNPNQTLSNIDCGLIGKYSIGNQVWLDVNNNGLFDGDEAGMAGLRVYLLNGGTNAKLDSTSTDDNGRYVFSLLEEGNYKVEVTIPSGHRSTTDGASVSTPNDLDNDDNGEGIALSGNVTSASITIEAGGGASSGANHSESDHGSLVNGKKDNTSNPKAYYTVDFGFATLPVNEIDCTNGIDDDGDGLVDCDDPDCAVLAEAGPNFVINEQDTVLLKGSVSEGKEPFSYSWSPSSRLSANNIAEPNAFPLTTTNFTLTVTDDNGCTDTDQARVLVDVPGPGGENTNLLLWLKGGSGITKDGSNEVSEWVDQSPNAYTLSQEGSEMPAYEGTSVNFNPGLVFSGDAQELLSGTGPNNGGYDEHTFFIVAKNASTAAAAEVPFQYNAPAVWGFYYQQNGNYSLFRWSEEMSNPDMDANIAPGRLKSTTPTITSKTWDESNSTINVYRDGMLNKTASDSDGPVTEVPNWKFTVGARRAGGYRTFHNSFGYGFNGEIAEVIFFDKAVDDMARAKIETYLAVKYGITMKQNYVNSQGETLWELGGGFDHDIAGIGRDDDSDLYQKQSRSVNEGSILTGALTSVAVDNASNSGVIRGDRSYLLWGNNDGTLVADNSSLPGPEGWNILGRVWKAARSGVPGNVTLAFDLSDFSSTVFDLILDTDGDGLLTDETPVSGSASGTTLTFSDVSLSDGTLFTLAAVNSEVLNCEEQFDLAATTGIGLTESENTWAASWGDYDGDGDDDLMVPDFATWKNPRMYRNNGDGTFSNVSIGQPTNDLGSNVGASWGDYDNDGDLDLFMANNVRVENYLYRNEGGGSFTRIEEGDVAGYNGYNHSGSWVDIDNDGYLDIFSSNLMPTRYNQLYRNNGSGGFYRVPDNALTLEAVPSMSGSWSDYDQDGLMDLFVSNVWGNNNSLFHNEGNGEFSRVTTGDIVTDGGNSNGGSWGDFDNDGDMDLYVTNASNQGNYLYVNNGDGTFSKNTSLNIATDVGHSFGSVWADLDNDGDLDLYVANASNTANKLYMNNGDGTFTANTSKDGSSQVGNSLTPIAADYDKDGDVDIYVANSNYEENNLYQNNASTNCNNWKQVVLIGTRSNRSGIGAKIHLKATIGGSSVWQMREVSSLTGGINGHSSLVAHFGLGNATSIDTIKVVWPSGIIQYVTGEAINNCVPITEESGTEVSGISFIDANGNCSFDVGETPVPNISGSINSNGLTVTTDSNGVFTAYLQSGSYTYTQESVSGFSNSCGSTINFSPSSGAGYEIEIPLTADCSGADLNVEVSSTALRLGMQNTYAIVYRNEGTESVNNVEVSVEFDPDVIPLSADVAWDRVESGSVGDVFIWDIGTVPAFSSATIMVTDSVSALGTLGRPTNTTANITPTSGDCNDSDNSYNDSPQLVGAIDPNDILVMPKGSIAEDDMLTYRIRFQNVGSFLAERVLIQDTLSKYLDPSTLKVISHSHNYEVSIQGNVASFVFDYIMLPDSNNNEPESHGYVEYEIYPAKNVPSGSVILNRAAIQFDNNPFIITNTVGTLVLGENGTMDTEQQTKEEDEKTYQPILSVVRDMLVVVFPNPVSSVASVRYQAEINRTYNLRIINSLGQTMVNNEVTPLGENNLIQIELSSWPAGYYYVDLYSKQRNATFKFVKH